MEILEPLTNPAFYAGMISGGLLCASFLIKRLPPKAVCILSAFATSAILLDHTWSMQATDQDAIVTIGSAYFWGVFAGAVALCIVNDFHERRRT